MATLSAGCTLEGRRQSNSSSHPTDRRHRSQKQLNRIKLSRELMQRLTCALSGGSSQNEQFRLRSRRKDRGGEEEEEEVGVGVEVEQEEAENEDVGSIRVASKPQRASKQRRRQKCTLRLAARAQRVEATLQTCLELTNELGNNDEGQEQVGKARASRSRCAIRAAKSGARSVEPPPSCTWSSLSIIDDDEDEPKSRFDSGTSSSRRRPRQRRSIGRIGLDSSSCQDDKLRQQVAPAAHYCDRSSPRPAQPLSVAAICQLNGDQFALLSSTWATAAPNNGIFKYLIAHHIVAAGGGRASSTSAANVRGPAPFRIVQANNGGGSIGGASRWNGTKLDCPTSGGSETRARDSRGPTSWRRPCCSCALAARCNSLAATRKLCERGHEIKSTTATKHNKLRPSKAASSKSSSASNSTPIGALWPFSGRRTLANSTKLALGHYNHCYYHANEPASESASSSLALVFVVGERLAASFGRALTLWVEANENQEIIVTCCLSWPSLSWSRPAAIGRVSFIANGNRSAAAAVQVESVWKRARSCDALGQIREALSRAFIGATEERDANATALETVQTRQDTRSFMARARKKFAATVPSESSCRMGSRKEMAQTPEADNDERHRQSADRIQPDTNKRRLKTPRRRPTDTNTKCGLVLEQKLSCLLGPRSRRQVSCATNERRVNLIIRKRRRRQGKLPARERHDRIWRRHRAGQVELVDELELSSEHSTGATLLEVDHFYDLHHCERHNSHYSLSLTWSCCFYREISSQVDGFERQEQTIKWRHQPTTRSLQAARFEQPNNQWRNRSGSNDNGASGPRELDQGCCLDELRLRRFGQRAARGRRRRAGWQMPGRGDSPQETVRLLNNGLEKSVIEHNNDGDCRTQQTQFKTSPCNSKCELITKQELDCDNNDDIEIIELNQTNGSSGKRAGASGGKRANHLHDSTPQPFNKPMNSTLCDSFRLIDEQTQCNERPTNYLRRRRGARGPRGLSRSWPLVKTSGLKLGGTERGRLRSARWSLLIWLLLVSTSLILDSVLEPLIGPRLNGAGSRSSLIMQSSAMLTQATNVSSKLGGATADELNRAVMATMSTPSSLSSGELPNSTRPLAMPQGGYQESSTGQLGQSDELDPNSSGDEFDQIPAQISNRELQISSTLQQQQQAVEQTDTTTSNNLDKFLYNLIDFARIFAMVAIMIGDICGNSLVILSVVRHSKLRVTTNWFVVSLACADILVAVFAMTFNASVQITGRWIFPRWMCDFWNSCDVLTATASILHLCCISIDRYYAIMRPLDYPMKITTRRVCYALAVVWISSALLSYIPIFTGIYTTAEHTSWQRAHPDQCEFVVNRVYAIVSSSISFWIPCCIMVFTYWRIYKEATRQEKFIYKAQNMLPAPQLNHHSSNHRAKQHRSKSMAVTSLSSSSGVANANNKKKQLEQLAKRTICEDDESKAPSGSDSLQVVAVAAANSTPAEKQPLTGSAIDLNNNKPSPATVTAADQKRPTALASKLTRQQQQDDQDERDSNSGQSTPTKRSISKMKREHKAAKTLGIIMGVFILCWLPFFTWYTPVHICGKRCEEMVPKGFVSLLFWIGYFNSTLNPIIYAYFNHEFRDAFKKTLQWIFCCCRDLKCLRVNRPNDNQHYNCTYRSTQEIGLVTNG